MRRTASSQKLRYLFAVLWKMRATLEREGGMDAASSQGDANRTGNSLPSGRFVITLAARCLEYTVCFIKKGIFLSKGNTELLKSTVCSFVFNNSASNHFQD